MTEIINAENLDSRKTTITLFERIIDHDVYAYETDDKWVIVDATDSSLGTLCTCDDESVAHTIIGALVLYGNKLKEKNGLL